MRVGVIYQVDGLGRSSAEQLLGVRLAAEHLRDESDGPGRELELVEHKLPGDGASLAAGLTERVRSERWDAVLGILPVPLSAEAAQWSEVNGVLYATANNNPRVGGGRRCVFYIGVPSEVTAGASMTYLRDERGAARVAVLHTPGEFQVHAAECMVVAAGRLGIDATAIGAGLAPVRDAELVREIRAYRADAVCVMGSELDRIVELVPSLGDGGVPVLLSRGMLCREFAERCGAAAEGFDFIDVYLRTDEALNEEHALMERVARADEKLVVTASHGFGWDCLKLLVEALVHAPEGGGEAAAYLESVDAISGATGMLAFDATDHNGRWRHDPTTVARLTDGRFVPVAKLARR